MNKHASEAAVKRAEQLLSQGLTPKVVAARLGISQQIVRRIVKGEHGHQLARTDK